MVVYMYNTQIFKPLGGGATHKRRNSKKAHPPIHNTKTAPQSTDRRPTGQSPDHAPALVAFSDLSPRVDKAVPLLKVDHLCRYCSGENARRKIETASSKTSHRRLYFLSPLQRAILVVTLIVSLSACKENKKPDKVKITFEERIDGGEWGKGGWY